MALTLPHHARALVVAGTLLFLLGLCQGVVVSMFANPRMGLSAHLTAVQSGMALMILGLVWSNAAWSKVSEPLSFWTTLAGTIGLWLGLTLAAATGASEALPIAGKGHAAPPIVEAGVATMVILSGGLMIIGWLLFALGLLRSNRR